MYNVNLRGNEYRVWFNHQKIKGKSSKASHVTECHITNGMGDNIIELSSAVAHCSKEDNFSRAVGREISLDRTIKKLYWLRTSEVLLLWSLYFKQMHQ